MAYEYFYGGGKSSLEPGADNIYTGATLPAASIGAPTSIQTANQITEVSNLLNTGMKAVEVSALNPEIFDMIPKQHLKEINRLSELTGSDISMHAPALDPSGFTQQGWSEQNREEVERQFSDIVTRAHEMSPNKPMPITIHASIIPGTETMPANLVKGVTEKEREKYGDYIPTQMIAVEQETGQFIPLKREERFYPEAPQGKIYTPEKELEIANTSYWDNKLSQLIFYKERADELLSKNYPQIKLLQQDVEEGRLTKEQFQNKITSDPQLGAALNNINNAQIYLENTRQVVNSLYNQAYKFANKEAKKELLEKVEKYRSSLGKAHEIGAYSGALQGIINSMKEVTVDNPKLTPQIYKPVEQFATDKASETFANIAFHAWNKFHDKAPIISIENPPYGSALSTGSDLRNLVEETRVKFIQKAKDKGMSESEAKKAAEQMIGVTWDTSHISMMRKQGYDKEALIEQAKKIAPVLKHIHLNDNFGGTHTDLPPGMGTVPIKEILAEFEKKGYKGKHIFEGTQFFQHFKTSPHAMVLEAMGSPVYAAVAQPSWSQVYGTMGAYSSGYGPFLPEQHFSIYGAGFAGLPTELGGQIPGKQSRFSGTPMA